MWWLDAESPSHPTNSSETLKHGGTQPRDQHTQVIADWVAKSDLQDKSIDQLQKQIACHQDESQQTKNQLESQIELQCSQIANLESHAQSQETQFLQQLAQSQDALRTAESEHVQTRDQQAQIIAGWVAKGESQDKIIDQLQKQIASHQDESQQTKNQLESQIELQCSQIANLESHAQSQETQFSQQLAQSQDALRTAESEHVQTRDQHAQIIAGWVAKSESQDKIIDQLQSFIETLNAQATAREGLLNQKLVQFQEIQRATEDQFAQSLDQLASDKAKLVLTVKHQERTFAEMQEKLAQSAMVQHSRALDEHSRKSNAMQDIIDEQQRLLNESHLDFTELTDQKRQLAEQIASLNSSLEDQVHLLDENRCSMVDEQQARKHAETNLANSNQTIALLNVKTEALENSLQREAAGRRKAEAALRRASVTAEIDSIARTSQMQIDAEKKVLRLRQELSSTKLLALSHHRMAQANIKQGQVEIERLMRLLDSMHRNPQNESAIRNAG